MTNVIIMINEGCIEQVIANDEVNVVILEHDDGASPDSLFIIEAKEYYNSSQVEEIDPERVDKILNEIEYPVRPGWVQE
jgi:hypothetical protein